MTWFQAQADLMVEMMEANCVIRGNTNFLIIFDELGGDRHLWWYGFGLSIIEFIHDKG